MDYTFIVRPFLGAVIGYVTNYIAVKMLFRPIHPIKIGKIKLPFTPGVIPKNKERIAMSIGETISTHLLTEESLSKTLLSDEKKDILHKKIEEKLLSIPKELTVKEGTLKIVSKTSYEKKSNIIKEMLTQKIVMALIEEDTGKIIATQIESAVDEKLNSSLLGMLGIGSLVSGLSNDVARRINEYISEHGNEMISNMISKEFSKIEATSLENTIKTLSNSEIDIASSAIAIYDKVIRGGLTEILNTINISKIVTDRINEMDMLELEKLILSIMKKELNALVNLGALIGFILGLLNLFF